MNMHDLVIAADDAQLGMPEILRGSFGQLVTSTLLNGRIPIKKVTCGPDRPRLAQRPGGGAGGRHG